MGERNHQQPCGQRCGRLADLRPRSLTRIATLDQVSPYCRFNVAYLADKRFAAALREIA